MVAPRAGGGPVPSTRTSPWGPLTGRAAGCFQVALTCTQIWWTTEVGLAFARLEEGYENAIKDYNKKQVRGPGSHVGGPPFPLAGSLGPWRPPQSRPGGATSQIRNFNFLSGNRQILLQAFFLKKKKYMLG